MNDEQLLKALQEARLLNDPSAEKLKREAKLSGRPVEELIYRQRLIPDEKVAEIKSSLLRVPYQKVDFDKLDDEVLGLVPEETARTYGVVPLAKREDLLVAGMMRPDDQKAQEALKFLARRNRLNLGVYLISYSDWQEVIRRYSPYRSEVEKAVHAYSAKPQEGGRRAVRLDEGATGEEAPVIKIVAQTFTEAVQSGASDIHVEPQEQYLRVRFRVNGELREVTSLPGELGQPIVSRIKVISNLKIDETRIPQDGRFRTRIFDRDVDFRVSTFPTPLGEKVAIRVLDPTTGLRSFDELGLVGKNLEIVNEGIGKPYGMILVTGPTGSGKTTTLYALLKVLNKESANIVSLEDPVEYFVEGVNQSQVRPEIGYDFASGLRQILRQDPDIIMVGEIRDSETAGLAVQAALTGHIVLSTLHTNNAVGVVPRLIDMKVEPFLLPVSLNLMISQRLVGLLCSHCRTAEVASPAVQKIIKRALSDLGEEAMKKFQEPYKIYHAQGCAQCKGRGIVGRVALYEVFQMSPAVEEIINTGPTAQRILKEAKNQGITTLRQDGILKALAGTVSAEEVLRETEE
ncbi:type II/IV secretion system protein [Candidatus Parcubacteria bacterium]|nr:MAG: type II/IV secretion system protein [Candidatus Parcubacteria bacterium]